MRIVLDTGILIAALITRDTPPDRIYQAWRKRRFELVTSEWQLEEFRRVSRYPKLRKYLQPIEAGNLVSGLRHQARLLDDLPDVELSADPDATRCWRWRLPAKWIISSVETSAMCWRSGRSARPASSWRAGS